MKKLLPLLAVLASTAVLASALRPAVRARTAQAGAQALEARVAALEGELASEKKRHDEARVLLEQTLAYLDKEARAAQTLLAVLDESEQQGFAMGENWRSRATLLAGLRAYWSEQQAGLPKAPAPPPVKALAPARPVRVREE